MSLSADAVFNYLSANFGLDRNTIDASTALFSGGFLDSLSLADLIAFIETNGQCQVAADEVTLENLDSVERIVAFTSRKTAVGQPESSEQSFA